MKFYGVAEVGPGSPAGGSRDDSTYHRAQKTENNLVQISIKLALIFSLMTVSDTEPVRAVIKTAPHSDGFHYRAC